MRWDQSHLISLVGVVLLFIGHSYSHLVRLQREAPVESVITPGGAQTAVSSSHGADSEHHHNHNHSHPTNTTTTVRSLLDGVQSDGVAFIGHKPTDRNYVPNKIAEEELLEDGGEGSSMGDIPGQPKFDDKAVQRALIVTAVLAFMILVYLAIKFMLLKKKKISRRKMRYGRLESEMDLLDVAGDEDSDDDEEELFDVNTIRRTNP